MIMKLVLKTNTPLLKLISCAQFQTQIKRNNVIYSEFKLEKVYNVMQESSSVIVENKINVKLTDQHQNDRNACTALMHQNIWNDSLKSGNWVTVSIWGYFFTYSVRHNKF